MAPRALRGGRDGRGKPDKFMHLDLTFEEATLPANTWRFGDVQRSFLVSLRSRCIAGTRDLH